MPIYLKNITSDQLHAKLSHVGLNLKTARRIQGYIFRKGKFPSTMNEVSDRLLNNIREMVVLPNISLIEKTVSAKDDFAKYSFQGEGAGYFEAVRIPLMNSKNKKYIVCVSSQIGCNMNCAFCMTGKMGFIRNLATWEIVDQVIKIQEDSDFPIRGVVFMGMGEPMLNFDSVMQAAKIFSEPCGMAISAKAITISTVGIVPGIKKFTQQNIPYKLIVSLSSANSASRSKIMPVEKIYPLTDLFQAIREYCSTTNQKITLAWTMIKGFNISENDARELASLTKDLPVKLDLIDVNDPSENFQAPNENELNLFRDFLRKHINAPVDRRYSGGKDICASCGMLARNK